MNTKSICMLALCLVAPAFALSASSAEKPPAVNFLRVDQLPRFRPAARVGSFSSYDRTGGNDDGFSGRHSFLRKEGDGLVLAELAGAGAITRIWTPTPTEDPIEFYFDGETTPRLRLPFISLFKGDAAPFLKPLSGAGAGGYYTYVPLEFAKSVKVVMRAAKVQFYQINYMLYEPGVPARSFQPGDAAPFSAPEAAAQPIRGRQLLSPGKAAVIFETNRPGRIASLKLGPAHAFAREDRSVVLRIIWDGAGRPAVEVPVGDLFGHSFGQPSMRSLLAGTDEDWNYLYFPMPFDRSARVELIDQSVATGAREIQSEIAYVELPRRADEGYFHALWRRENPAAPGQPFTFLDARGRGHAVGVLLQVQGKEPGHTYYFEGDDQAIIDGQLTAHGTGSEDFFNGGWYDLPGRWNGSVSLPFSGCLEYRKHLSRTGGYRWLLADAYAFRNSLKLTIEHGGEGNSVPGDYVATTLFYLDQPSMKGQDLAPLAERAVHPPETFSVTPGWQEPIFAFSFDHATITKVRDTLGGRQVRYLSLRKTGNPEYLKHFVAITVDVPAAGDYAISAEFVASPDGAIVRMLLDDQPVGESADLYAAERALTGLRPLSTLKLQRGLNHLFFAITGSNPKSSGAGFDLVRIQLQAKK